MELYDEDVRAILQLLDASSFDELCVDTDRFSLTLRRADGAWTRETRTSSKPRELIDAASPSVGSAPSVGTAAADGSLTSVSGAARPEGNPADARLVAVLTPLPGTFYRSPKPGSPPFVEVGTPVARDTVVAIVETMKLMNSVYAGVAGRVVEICYPDASLVAQRAVLLRIEPDLA